MQRKDVSWAVITLAGVVVFLAGCQSSGFRRVRQETSDQHDRPLNERQVADVQLSLARSLELRGEIEPALNAYRQAVEKDPQRATGYWRMAILQDQQGKVEESDALYRQALVRDSKNSDLLCDYGYSLYLQRRWAEAEERLRQAITINPKHSRAHNHLGLVLAQAECTSEALAEFRKAGCSAADARSNLAFVMTLNHRWDDAREQYELALDADPDSAAAMTGLENLESVAAKASPSDGVIKLADYNRSVESRPATAVQQATLKTSPVSIDTVGRATVSTTNRAD